MATDYDPNRATNVSTTAPGALPMPLSASEWPRVEHTRLRRRMIYGQHRGDVEARVIIQLGMVRAAAWGIPDTTANPLQALASQLAVLYDNEPEVLDPNGNPGIGAELSAIGHWPLMQRIQRDTVALNEMLVRFDLDDAGNLVSRGVFPDMVEAEAAPSNPMTPLVIREAVEDPSHGWVWHEYDIRDPAAPAHRVYDRERHDVTALVLGSDSSWPESLRKADGTPFLPYVFYHSTRTGYLFDPFTGSEIVEGTLNICVNLTFYGHMIRNASWPQRYIVGAHPAGSGTMSENGPNGPSEGRTVMDADPATVLSLEQNENVTNVLVGQWQPGGDPETVLQSIILYKQQILTDAGLTSDVTRQDADIRSGYSLVVSRESIRAKQKVYEPQFREADKLALAICARLRNRASGGKTAYPEEPGDYRIAYHGLPLSPIESKAALDDIRAQQDAGLIGPITAYQAFNPLATRDEAIQKLAEGAAERDAVERATRKLITGDTAPPLEPLSPGMLQPFQVILSSAASGTYPKETAKALLILSGVPAASAAALIDPIDPTPTIPAPIPNVRTPPDVIPETPPSAA